MLHAVPSPSLCLRRQRAGTGGGRCSVRVNAVATPPPPTKTPLWTPESWRKKEARQMPSYSDPAALKAATDELRRCPPLIFAGEVRHDAITPPIAQIVKEVGGVPPGRPAAARATDGAPAPIFLEMFIREPQMRQLLTGPVFLRSSLSFSVGARPPPQSCEGGERRGLPSPGESEGHTTGSSL